MRCCLLLQTKHMTCIAYQSQFPHIFMQNMDKTCTSSYPISYSMNIHVFQPLLQHILHEYFHIFFSALFVRCQLSTFFKSLDACVWRQSNMAAYLLCLTADGGIPLFTRTKGNLPQVNYNEIFIFNIKKIWATF